MKFTFKLHDTKNDKIVEYQDPVEYEDADHMYFQWFKGNFSCDCNKRSFMYPELDIGGFVCGDEVVVMTILNEKDEIIYQIP